MKKILSFLIVAALLLSIMPFSAFAVKNPVKAIRYVSIKEVTIEENTYKFYNEADKKEYYLIPYLQIGDKLTVIDNNDQETVYVLNISGEFVSEGKAPISLEEIGYSDTQGDIPWGLGDHEYTISYSGRSCTLTAHIVKNPISSVVYTPAEDVVIYEYASGYWAEEQYYYVAPWFREGDSLTVNYADDAGSVVYTYIDGSDEFPGGFYDGEVGALPDELNLITCCSGEWSLGGDNYMYVLYKGNKTNEVPVTILDNPVKAIRYERVGDAVYIENSHMHYDYIDDRYYYDVPNSRLGDKLILIDENGAETEYVYDNYFEFICDGKDPIYAYNIEYVHDQLKNPWGIGEHEYKVRYMGREYPLTVSIVENPYSSIEYTRAEPDKFYENAGGEFDEELGYYVYWYDWYREGDILTVTEKGGAKKDYVFGPIGDEDEYNYAFIADDESIIEAEEIHFIDHQDEAPWTLGDNNDLFVEYCGMQYNIHASVVDNPVKAIRFSAVNSVLVEGVRAYYDYDLGYDVFDYPEYSEGDQLTVIGKDKSEKVYTAEFDEHHEVVFRAEDGETISSFDLFRDDNQHEEQWVAGGEYEYTIEYMGAKCSVSCTVLPNPVVSIEYDPKTATVYTEGTHMYYDEWDEMEYYERPRIEEGDKLTVNFANDVTVVYTARFDNDLECMVFESETGDKIVTDSDRWFNLYDEQFENPWTVGDDNFAYISYYGRVAEIPVTIEPGAGSHKPGDINGDNKVNNKDLVRLFQYLSKWKVDVNTDALDVNGDNKINNKDLVCLFQYLSKWKVEIF